MNQKDETTGMNIDKWIKNKIQGGTSKEIRPFNKNFQQNKQKGAPKARPFEKDSKLKVIPLGGLEEVGKNCMAFEYGNEIIVVDMGLQFPEEDMLGIDYVIPDTTYLEQRKDKVKAIIITHGHLDHIGGIPYIWPKLGFPPIYATNLTAGLIESRLDEFRIKNRDKIKIINPDKPVRVGKFEFDFFRVNHSIPDAVGMAITTPVGTVVHTGDFKFDFTPADKILSDYAKIASLSKKNVIALFSDSTNATKPGHTISEKEVAQNLDNVIKETEGRIIIASFSSLIGRIQDIIASAGRHGRQVFVSGRSMLNNIDIAKKRGFLNVSTGCLKDIKHAKNVPDRNALILTTGSQGEAVSALTRMAIDEHAHVKIKNGDTVILSSSPIIGNERAIVKVINNLCKKGANVITNFIMDIHTSGHGQEEDLKLMMSLVKPKYLIPVHGELFMRKAHGKIGENMGIPEKNIHYIDNGSILEIDKEKVTKLKESVDTDYVMVDGKGVGDVGSQVLMDRQTMAENGTIIIAIKANNSRQLLGSPDVITRGFMYMKDSPEMNDKIAKIASEAYSKLVSGDMNIKRGDLKRGIKRSVDKFVHKMIERAPLVLPIIISV